MADILTGADAVVDEVLSYQKFNKVKNHYRASTAPADIQPGMLYSDSDDDRLYHRKAAANNELLQLAAAPAIGDILYASAATGIVTGLADVAAGSYLRSGGVGAAPVWSTLLLPNAGTAFKLPVFSATNTMTELAAVGATGEYLAGATGAIPAWATLNQAAVAGLTTASSPEFVTVKLSGLTDGYIPYHVSDAAGLADSGLSWSSPTLTISANSDTITFTHDGTDAYFKTTDGSFIFQTDEGTNTESYISVRGKGTGNGNIDFWTNGVNVFGIYPQASITYFGYSVPNSIFCWSGITSGNPEFRVYGWDAGAAAVKYGSLSVLSTGATALVAQSGENLWLQANALELNVTSLYLYGNSDTALHYLDGSDYYIKWSDGNLILQTDEGTNTLTRVEIKPKGTSEISILALYDTNAVELEFGTAANSSYITGTTALTIYGSNAANGDLSINGTSNGTHTTSCVYLQPLGGYTTIVGAGQDGTPGDCVFFANAALLDTYRNKIHCSISATAANSLMTFSLSTGAATFADALQLRGDKLAVHYGLLGFSTYDFAVAPVGGDMDYLFSYSDSVADDASVTLPDQNTHAYGIVLASVDGGALAEYATFIVDNDGDVTLLANSANVVANADTDTKLCIGTAAAQANLLIKNRLGAARRVSVWYWYY